MAQNTSIALQLYSIRTHLQNDLFGTLKQLKNWGVTTVEGSTTYGLSIEEYKSVLDSLQLKTLAISAEFDQLHNTDSLIEIAKALNTTYVVCYWIPHKIGNFTKADMDSAIQLFSEAGAKLKSQGLQFCFHPHHYEFGVIKSGKTYFDYLIEKTTPDQLQIELDVFWVRHSGFSTTSLLKKYKERIEIVHLKDRNPELKTESNTFADPESSTVLGSGDVGIQEVVEICKELNIPHLILEDESSKSLKQIPESIKYLKSIEAF